MDVINRVPNLRRIAADVKQGMRENLIEHQHYIRTHGDDMPEVRDWQWPH